MSTRIRPETSKKNPYYISKHRQYELKHFVMQYPEWEEKLRELRGIVRTPPTDSDKVNNGFVSDITGDTAVLRELYSRNIDMVVKAAEETHPMYGLIIAKNVICEQTYRDWSEGQMLSRDEYYRLYRKFFYILDKLRDSQI